MAFADPEDTAAFLASLEQQFSAFHGAPGALGAAARGVEAFQALSKWLIAEHGAQTHFPDISAAAASIAGSFLGSVVLSSARKGGEMELLVRLIQIAAEVAAQSVKEGPTGFVHMHEGHKQ